MAGTRFLGIDVGTTSVKAGIVNDRGQVEAHFSQPYPTQRQGANWVEQDPSDWLRLINDAMDAFVDHDVAAIGLTSQVNTHVFTDADGALLMPAILWQDGRAGAEAAALDSRIAPEQKIEWWGAPMPVDASNVLSRMAWMAQHRPAIWDATRWVMLPKDYCLFHLTGQAITDPLSNIGLVDTALRAIPDALDLVPGAADRMLPLAQPCDIVGQIRKGPFAGKPVVTGTMDAWAGLVGTGGAQDGSTIYLSGTSEILGISSRKVHPTPGVVVFSECDGIRLHAAPTQSGGDAVKWFVETHALSLEDLSALVARSEPGQATPLFLPQLEGERAPIWDADLRGAFLNVSRRSTRADLARSVFEGVAFSTRMALDALRASAQIGPGPITCGGGGFSSAPWAQIRADVLDVEIRTLSAQDPGVLGAATMAAIGTGHFSDFAEASAAMAEVATTYGPNARLRAHYDALYDLYQEALSHHAELGKRIFRASAFENGV